MALFKKKSQEEIDRELYTQKLSYYRENYIPEEYNQAELLNHLLNPELDHYIDISSRGDGKSFNYFGALLYLSIEIDLKPMFMVRHYELQAKIRDFIRKVTQTIEYFDPEKLYFVSSIDYITVGYNDKEIALILDFNNASDLKFSSNILSYYPIMVYEEFLALKDDYLPDEFEKLKLIYTSVDRQKDRRFINHPKLLYLGNPVNFDSPILPALNMYNALQSQEMNTIKIYGNKILSIRRNDNINDRKNTRAFEDDEDSNFTGQFNYSNYLLVDENSYNQRLYRGQSIYIYMEKNLMLHIIKDEDDYILSIEKRNNKEQFCLSLSDETADRKYLDSKFYKDSQIRKHERNAFLFKDSFSRNYIQDSPILTRLKFQKCFTKAVKKDPQEIVQSVEKYDLLKSLHEKFELLK